MDIGYFKVSVEERNPKGEKEREREREREREAFPGALLMHHFLNQQMES
jgi:hypothetical protein